VGQRRQGQAAVDGGRRLGCPVAAVEQAHDEPLGGRPRHEDVDRALPKAGMTASGQFPEEAGPVQGTLAEQCHDVVEPWPGDACRHP
jgi:hypothetical protein